MNKEPAKQEINHEVSKPQPSVTLPAFPSSGPAQDSGTFSSTKSGVRKEPSGQVSLLSNVQVTLCLQVAQYVIVLGQNVPEPRW